MYLNFKIEINLYEQVEKRVEDLESCIHDVRKWMNDCYLKLNDDKTEFLLLGSRQQLSKIVITHIHIGYVHIAPSDKARNLGVIFDTSMSLDAHISKCVKAANYHLRNLRAIRKFLTPQTTQQLIHAFVTSHLDNCNSLLYGLPKYQIHRLQKVQNAAARLVTKSKRSTHTTQILKNLHWLPIEQRIKYKILLLTYRSLNGSVPEYISSLLNISLSSRAGLRSSNSTNLTQLRTKRSWGDRAFTAAAPRLWNSLPHSIKMSANQNVFQKQLKTYLMSEFLS